MVKPGLNDSKGEKEPLLSKQKQENVDSVDGKKKDVKKKASVRTMFRYATSLDYFLMIFGTLFAIVHGAGFPLLTIVFGDMSNLLLSGVVNNFTVEETNTTLNTSHIISLTTDLNPNIRLGRQLLQSVNDPQPPQIINSPNNQSNTQSANGNNQAINPYNIASNITRNNPVTATSETLNVNNQVKDGNNPTRINENPAKVIDSVANGKGSLDDASQSNSVYETTTTERTTPQIAPVTETTETLNVNNQVKIEDKPTRINENPEKIIDSVADGKGSLDDAPQSNTVYETTTTESTTSTWLTKNNLDLTDSGKENEQIEIPNTTTTKSSWTDHRNTNKEERSNVTLTEAVTSAYTFLTSTKFPSINLGLSIDLFNEKMTEFSLYYVGISAIVFISTLFQTYFWQLSCERQIYKIRQEFFYQALRQEIGWFDQHQSGEMTTRLADDLERIREGIGEKIGTFIQHTSSFVVGFVVGFIKGWELTLVIMSLTPLLALSSAFVGRLIATSTKREQQKYAEAGGIAEEVLSSMKTVTAFNGQEREVDRYCNSLQSGFNLAIRKYKFMSIGIGFTFLVLYSAYALAFWYGSQLILRGDLLPGSVYTVFFAVLIGSNALGQTSGPLNSVSVAAGSAYNIFKIIDTIPTIDPYSIGGKILDSVQGNIEFKSVKFNYPSRPDVQVLRNFNLNIKPGQTIALCGSSGSGKSTIVNLLLRFYDVLEGKITLDGHNIKTINLPWLRHIIGVVSQEPILFDRSIAENIRYGRSDVTYDEIVNAAKMANAHSFVCSLPEAYSTLVGERGAQLSGGQKQRIAIARALVRDPKILLLDEATSALDSESESIVQEALDKAGKGRTTVVVAHRLSTIRNADVIHAMENGIIKESGTHDELMNREGIYYSLVTKQTFDDGEGGYSSTDYDKTESRKQSFRKRLLTYQSSIGSTVGDMQENRLKFEAMEEEVEMAKFSQIAKAMKPEWLSNTVGILACVLTGLIMPVFAIFFAQMFEVFSLPAEEMESASVFWACMYLLLAVLQFFGFSIRINYLAKASENLTKRLRYLAFKNILRQDIGWFDDDAHSTGKISTRLATDAPMVKAAAGVRIASLVSACVTMIGGLVVAFIFGWKLALAITATVPLLILGGSFQMKMAKGKQQRDQILMADAGRVSSEALLNIKTVQALTREETFFQKYIGHLIEPFCESKKQAIYLALGFAFSQSIIFLIYAGAFRLGAYLIVIGDMSVINIYRVFFAISFSAVSVGEWSSYLPDYTKAKLSAALMFHLIKMDPKIDSYSEGGIKPNIIGEIQLKNVHFKYPSRPNVRVLKNMNLYVKSGQTLALVGHSGCGKSTVVSLIERFYDPTQGKVLIDGHDLRTMNLKYVRENIAIVDQEPILFNCSIKDNIKYGMTRKVLDDELINACKSANIHDFIASLPDGYNTNCGDKGTQLSGGQKQRISIARAIIRNPRILLLDEATSALDTESEKLVQDALEAAKSGRTCIIIAHRLATIQNADIIAVIDKGNVVESGSHQELVAKKGRYYSLTKKQRIAH